MAKGQVTRKHLRTSSAVLISLSDRGSNASIIDLQDPSPNEENGLLTEENMNICYLLLEKKLENCGPYLFNIRTTVRFKRDYPSCIHLIVFCQ